MVAIRLVYSHISIRWYKFRPYYYYGCRLQRESHLQELLSVSWPNARMGIKDPAVLRRIQDDSTEMEMMAALQTLSSNSMQAGLRAARNICCSPPLPAVSPPAFSWISAVDDLTPHPLIPKPHSRIDAEYWYCNICFSFTSSRYFPHLLQILCTDSIHIRKKINSEKTGKNNLHRFGGPWF